MMSIKQVLRSAVIALIVAGALFTTPIYQSVLTTKADGPPNKITNNQLLPVEQKEETAAPPAEPTFSPEENADAASEPSESSSELTEIPAAALIPLENIQQLPELPAGCEVTSLTMVLNYLDYNISKTRLADLYLPVSDEFYYGKDGKLYGPNQNDVFAGDPRSNQYGCYAPVIVKTANRYLEDCGSEYCAQDLSGSAPQELYQYVLSGTPVIVWATIEMKEVPSYIEWYDSKTGKKLSVPNRMHCLVLIGVDGDTLTFSDPYDQRGSVRYSKKRFEARYRAVGKQAVVITSSGA